MPLLFAMTLFVSATLLFLVQPMIAKMVLPLLGGTPAVWNTCMVFFQAALLAGYAYAHATTARLGVRRQLVVHALLLCLPFVVLPIAIRVGVPRYEANPIPWLLALLTVSVGLPFFVLSATAPLLQKWFAGTGHPAGKDPYFLYAASNLGSMLALLGYPKLVEPNLALKASAGWLSQSWLWAVGYGLFVVLMLVCARVVWRSPGATEGNGEGPGELDQPGTGTLMASSRPTFLKRLRWVALAFVPSSLMLGVTTHMTLDIAAIPLLWVIPLALYLLSFILVFSHWPDLLLRKGLDGVLWLVGKKKPSQPTRDSLHKRPGRRPPAEPAVEPDRSAPGLLHKGMVLVMPLVVLLVLFMDLAEIKGRIVMNISIHLLTLFLVAMVCHGELARDRPSTRYLTEFFLLMSLGGVLGGMFNALVAPLVFDTVVEYKLVLVCACLLLPRPAVGDWSLIRWALTRYAGLEKESQVVRWARLLGDGVMAASVGLVAFGLVRFFAADALPYEWLESVRTSVVSGLVRLSKARDMDYYHLRAMILFGLPTLVCYSFVTRPLRFGLAAAALLAGGTLGFTDRNEGIKYEKRSFFGVLQVKYYPHTSNGLFDVYKLNHGTTLHGEQSRMPEYRHEPLTYYHRTGPIGQVFEDLKDRLTKKDTRIGLIGLGSGTLACYGKPGMHLTFYDIDPVVVGIATNPEYFTYLADCRADYDIELGDARLKMEEAADGRYQLIVVDAFSSDAIPIHLITREAIQLFFRKLTADGVLAVHISNRYLDLRPVLANIAHDLGLVCIVRHDNDEEEPGKSRSNWVLLTQKEADLGKLADDISTYPDEEQEAAAPDNKRWRRVPVRPRVGVWTDDYSNILSVFMK